jgi:sec-independent protein translocase protein TatB
MLGRMQRYVNDVKSDIQREMELDELKKLQTTIEDSAREIETSVSQDLAAAENDMKGVQQAVSDVVNDAQAPAAETPAAPGPAAAPAAIAAVPAAEPPAAARHG